MPLRVAVSHVIQCLKEILHFVWGSCIVAVRSMLGFRLGRLNTPTYKRVVVGSYCFRRTLRANLDFTFFLPCCLVIYDNCILVRNCWGVWYSSQILLIPFWNTVLNNKGWVISFLPGLSLSFFSSVMDICYLCFICICVCIFTFIEKDRYITKIEYVFYK